MQTFKTETRERFDKVDESIKDLNENIEGIIGDYHPHIVALEEKVLGFLLYLLTNSSNSGK